MNAGDINSSPVQYFEFENNIGIVNIDLKSINLLKSENYENLPLIIGGGGIFYDYQAHLIEDFCYWHKGIKILWGAGFNYSNCNYSPNIPYYFKKFKHIGLRDYLQNTEWVPCASCMHDIFDNKYEEKNEIGIIEHLDCDINLNFPKISNSAKIEDIIFFIGSCKKIITNSYHGYYWSVLMNKEVNIIPFRNSSKFYNLKYKVPIIKTYDKFIKSEKFNYALKECREANINFYNKIKKDLIF